MKIRTKMQGVSLIFAIILLFPCTSFSQSYLTKNYTILSGMASPSVNDITQDIYGKMWFATVKGISCYDGTSWHNFSNSDGIPGKEFSFVRADKKGNIWAFLDTINKGIYIFKNGQWEHISSPWKDLTHAKGAISSISFMDMDNKSIFAIGTFGNGLHFYDTVKRQWIHSFGRDGSDDRNSKIYSIDNYGSDFYFSVQSGIYYVGKENLHYWHPLNANFPDSPVYAIAVDHLPMLGNLNRTKPIVPRLWMVGADWVGFFDFIEKKFYPALEKGLSHYIDVTNIIVLAILPDRYGGLWLGNNRIFMGISNEGKLFFYGKQNAFTNEGAYALFYDRENNLWLGNFRGTTKIISFRFEGYNKIQGFFEDEVCAISQFKNGWMAFGHNGGFTFYNLKSKEIVTRKIPESIFNITGGIRVLDMCRTRDGNIWAAVSTVGIARITPEFDIKWYKPFSHKKENDYYCSSIMEDTLGNLWAGVNNNVCKWNPVTGRFDLYTTSSLISNNIRKFFPDTQNKSPEPSLYIALSLTNLLKLTGKNVSPIFTNEPDDNTSFYAIHRYNKTGDLLAGTNNGLFILKDGKLNRIRNPILIKDTPVYFLTEDWEKNIWIGTLNGLIKWDGENARHYTSKEGLLGTESNRSAGFIDSEGKLWIGTESGVSRYYRERDFTEYVSPLLELYYIKAGENFFSLHKDLQLPSFQNDLTFHFKAISFIDETGITYNIKLEGYDKSWVTAIHTRDNRVRYTNLPPGKYRFYVQAINSAGIKSDIKSSGIISIAVPYHRSWWFYTLLVSAPLLILILALNFISGRRYTSILEKRYIRSTMELAASEKELRNIFNMAHDAILILDPITEVVLDVNQRACQIYGFERSEFIGLNLESISKDISRGKRKLEETLKKGDYLHFETMQYRKDGREMILEINASVIEFRGNKAILSINRDITERKKAEERIKHSLSEKEVLLREVHHRVKNNLQIISSLLDLQSYNEEQPEIVQVFQESKNRIRSMALAHETLYQSENMAKINAYEYFNSVLSYFLGTYGNMGDQISYRVFIEEISLDMDTAIPVGLILTELLSNTFKHAFHHGKKGQLTVSFRVTKRNLLKLLVRDNGPGLPDSSESRKNSSLGLQLVDILTRQLKGNKRVIVNNGTAFIISFPYQEIAPTVETLLLEEN